MARYEYKDAKSSKFWEITLDGDTYTVRFGKIGTDGTVQSKVFSDEATAQKEHDKAVKKKTKKGYVLVASAATAPAAAAGPGADLEAAIHAAPDSRQAWEVYADFLSTQGDPRGELILLHYAAQDGAGDAKAINARAKEVFDAHSDSWMGKELAKLAAAEAEVFSLDWWCGFIIGATVGVSWDEDVADTPAQARIVMSSPAARFIRSLSIGLDSSMEDGEADFGKSILAVTRLGKNHSLRKLHVGNFEYPDETEISWTSVGDVSKLYPVFPNLEDLHVTGGSIQLGTLAHAKLKKLWIETGGLPREAARSLSAAKLPELEELDIWFGTDEYGGTSQPTDIDGLLQGDRFPKLKKLALKNAEHQNAITERVVASPLLAHVEELDLSMGTMTEPGVAALLAAAEKLSQLTSIDVSENAIQPEHCAQLSAAFGSRIDVSDQDVDDPDWIYVSVGE